jgi:two-component system OmpR family response regulator
MSINTTVRLFLVDDDALFLKKLELELGSQGDFEISTFATGERCLEKIGDTPDVVILDYHLDGIEHNAMNGLDTLDKIKIANDSIPVIMLSSQDKIDIAISCMHHKAYDYVVKSETAVMRLNKIIASILQYRKLETQMKWYMARM